MAFPLTVVITSYNREAYIGAAIKSVLASGFRDYELLVLDDASSDSTVDIARELANIDRRIRVIVNDQNLGQFSNRNRALQLVKTRYLKYHDSDDVMYPHCLQTMMTMLEDTPEAGFALSASRCWPGGPCPMLVSPRDAYVREYLGQGMFNGGPSSALFRTDVLKRLGGFPERGVGSDYCFWLKACAEVSVVLVPADLFWYRIHGGQELVSEAAARDYAMAQGEGWQALLAENCPLKGAELESAKRRYILRLLRLTWRDVKAGRWRVARLRLQSAGVSFGDWIRYPPTRSSGFMVGTPMDKGDFVMPRWLSSFDAEASHRSGERR